MSAPENPQAFPSRDSLTIGDTTYSGAPGMTLRDWFAGQALPKVIEACRGDTDARKAPSIEGFFASKSYALADAMLAARQEQKL